MGKAKNRGKFGHKVGRPTNKMCADLNRKREIQEDPHNALRRMAREDIRGTDMEDVPDYNEMILGNDPEIEEWVWGFLSQGKNPFLFKTDGMIVQMGGLTNWSNTT